MRYHSFLSNDDAAWGERQVIRFRWILIAAIIVLIAYIFLSGEIERGTVSLILAVVYIIYNFGINVLLKKYDYPEWIPYVSSTIDVIVLSAHIFNYSYFFTPIAVATAPSLFLYAVLIMLSVLRYNGKLVVYTTGLIVVCSNLIYFIRYPQIDTELISKVASAGPEGAFYRSVYFILMGYFMFSIPKMINRLVEKQNAVNNERREIEIKLALETQRKELAIQNWKLQEQLTKELNRQKDVIEQQNKELEELVATKDKLFSIIGHDLRSPLCVQSSLSELLLHDFHHIDKEGMLESLYAIHKTANNGLEMLSNLMDWSKSQSKSLDPRPVKLPMEKVICRVIDQQSEAWAAKKLKVNYNIDGEVYAYADEHMFETVLRNLLSNAIKFTPDNGVVNFNVRLKENTCIVEIVDSGIGMNENQLDNLFCLNNTISSLGTNNEKGTGLGLILSKEMMDINKGKLKVESNPGKGTKFTVSLPAELVYN